jgi:fermentation-respiration switch protein FrsA (DUF1100 family)
VSPWRGGRLGTVPPVSGSDHDVPPLPSRRSPLWWILLAVAVAAALVVGGVLWWRADDDSSDTATTSDGDTAAEVTADHGVGRRDLTFVDPSRPTAELPDAGIAAAPDRTLQTVVLYPTDDEADEMATDAPAATGPFPLVVFSHGVGGNPDQYVELVAPLAASGYVVAMPAFPLSSRSGSAIFDVLQQPGDVSFVIDQLLALTADDGSWLAGRIDADRIAAAGHSLGAVTTIALTYDTCCRDDRIDAAVALSGIGVPSGPGALDDRPPTPLLLVHGTDDDVVPVAGSDTLFEDATGPVYYLRLDGADHTSLGFGEDGALTSEAIGAFLDAELEDEPAALDAMPDLVAASGLGEWRTRNAPSRTPGR